MVWPVEHEPDVGLADIERRAVQREMAAWLTDFLTQKATKLDRIGARVVCMSFALHQFDEGADEPPKQKELAALLNVSESRVSIAVSRMRQALEMKLKS